MSGTVSFELDIELWSNSGREKHTDLSEQGAWIANAIVQALRNYGAGPDFAIHDLRYLGDKDLSDESRVTTLPVSVGPTDE
jgi:hypothetical protein